MFAFVIICSDSSSVSSPDSHGTRVRLCQSPQGIWTNLPRQRGAHAPFHAQLKSSRPERRVSGVLKVTFCARRRGVNGLNGSTVTHGSEHKYPFTAGGLVEHSSTDVGILMLSSYYFRFRDLSHRKNAFENIKAFSPSFHLLKF